MLLRWALGFAIFALVAALLGAWGAAFVSLEIARIQVIVFVIVLIVSLVAGRRSSL